MNKLLFVFFLILQTGNSYCQNKYTVVYKTVYNKRINLVVRDSVAYCNYLSTGRSDKNIAIDTPLGKKFDGKASYYDAKRFIAILPNTI